MIKKNEDTLSCKLVFLRNNNLLRSDDVSSGKHRVNLRLKRTIALFTSPYSFCIRLSRDSLRGIRVPRRALRVAKDSTEDSREFNSRGTSPDRSILLAARDVTLQPSGYRYQRRNAVGDHARDLRKHVRLGVLQF